MLARKKEDTRKKLFIKLQLQHLALRTIKCCSSSCFAKYCFTVFLGIMNYFSKYQLLHVAIPKYTLLGCISLPAPLFMQCNLLQRPFSLCHALTWFSDPYLKNIVLKMQWSRCENSLSHCLILYEVVMVRIYIEYLLPIIFKSGSVLYKHLLFICIEDYGSLAWLRTDAYCNPV